MINDATRIMRKWVEHPTYGLAAQLAGVPRTNSAGGEDDLPPDPTIYDDVNDAEAVKNLEPPASPALTLYIDSGAELNLDRENYLVTGVPLVLAAAYQTREVPEDVATLWGGYTLRALRRCLRAFNNQSNRKGYGELNGIKVMKVGVATEHPVATDVGQSRLWGFVLANITVVDTLA